MSTAVKLTAVGIPAPLASEIASVITALEADTVITADEMAVRFAGAGMSPPLARDLGAALFGLVTAASTQAVLAKRLASVGMAPEAAGQLATILQASTIPPS